MLLRLRTTALRLPTATRRVPLSHPPLSLRCMSTALTQRYNPNPLSLQTFSRLPSNFQYTFPSIRSFSTSGPIDNISNPELYTETAYASISKLPNYANTYKTQYVETSHMLKSLYDEGPDGLMQIILTKCGISPDSFHK
jgi:hypothetical protein